MSELAAGEVAVAASRRSGAVILARHGEPALSRKIRLSAAGYRDWWADYEIGGIRSGQSVPPALRATARAAGAIIASTRLRSIQTALELAEGRAFVEDPTLVEAPLPPPDWPTWFKLSPRLWGFTARVWWWFFNHHQEHESRAQAQERAAAAADRLIELAASGQDVLVVAHGFFNTMVGWVLRQRGWRCTLDDGYGYWSARRFEARGGGGESA